ncbi:MAG: DUF1456 family protein [Granulosicoccus sp.]
MDINDLNRRVRFALSLDDAEVVDLLRLAEFPGDLVQISAWRLKEGEEGFLPCPPQALQAMLSGLIILRRGKRDDPSPDAPNTGAVSRKPPEQVHDFIDNNDVLKQIRIALSLKTDEVHALIERGGGKLGKSEINALFRNPGARNYRRCGDQVLRWFLAGLAQQRKGES